ncbi:MAG: thiol protease/hemagglutinin PrtT [Bacteroidales bacterium]|nr:thiol protease/hemagglutinin PrtT [Bacteroidales bacterium]
MKIINLLPFLIFSVIYIQVKSKPVTVSIAKETAFNKMILLTKHHSFSFDGVPQTISDKNGRNLFYLFNLMPTGFIAVSADNNLPPVLAYSFENNATENSGFENLLIDYLKTDVEFRLALVNLIPQEKLYQRLKQWKNLSTCNMHMMNKFEQWPPEGTTITGGWLETNWTQNAPYNNFCPVDPVTNQRSIAGCPAVAMAQIVNYYQTLNETIFDDEDDYYHSYSGRNYWIDDDFEIRDFPSFPQLNAWFDTISGSFETQSPLKPELKAALNYACGVAAKQVYTSSISGTFGVIQAYDAYMKFGFESANLLNDSDTNLYTEIAKNMMEGRPVHLAVVDPAGTMGHNLVIDGYNTDTYFHLNFGWGGSYNGWYLLPDEIPYGLTVIEGAIVDIAFPPVNTGMQALRMNDQIDVEIKPNPVYDEFCISVSAPATSECKLQIFDLSGNSVYYRTLEILENNNPHNYKIEALSSLQGGMYFCKISINGIQTCLKFIKLD